MEVDAGGLPVGFHAESTVAPHGLTRRFEVTKEAAQDARRGVLITVRTTSSITAAPRLEL